MASLQLRGDSWRLLFNYKGKQHAFTVGQVGEAEANSIKGKVEYLLMRLKQHLLQPPPDDRIVEFLQHDGKLPESPILTNGLPKTAPVTLAALRDDYLDLHKMVLDPRTIADMRGHWKHLARLLDETRAAAGLRLADLQAYVLKRVADGVEGTTAKKEIVTLRTIWNWAVRTGHLAGAFPNKGLRYPKGKEKPPFMTLAEVERRIAGGASDDLWESVFLTRDEVNELLQAVDEVAAYPWIPAMFWFAAHTGARRGEMLRVLNDDIDLEAGTVLIREKKRRRDVEESTRRVPLSDALRERLRTWLAQHPGGAHLFCHVGVVVRSRKRSKTTGYQGEKTRASTQKGRLARVVERDVLPAGPLSPSEASNHFNATIAGTKWENLCGWHVLRHSFVSNCAAACIDQRLIDAWVGHTTEEMRQRYRHLIPGVERAAIKQVFG